MNEQEFRLFRDFVAAESGLRFDETRRTTLESAIKLRIAATGAKSLYDYYEIIQSRRGRREIQELLNLLTVKETNFFRYPQQFVALREAVLPDVIRRKPRDDRNIRIMSAGCSTGEEPYSIAMTVHAVLGDADEWTTLIWATDISSYALSIAKRAVYGERSLRLVTQENIESYFEQHGEGAFRVRKTIRDMVSFEQVNLADPDKRKPIKGIYDIVFCRNVVIYFDMRTTRRVIRELCDALADGGYFFAGHSEVPNQIVEELHPHKVGGAFIYVKRAANELIGPPSLPESLQTAPTPTENGNEGGTSPGIGDRVDEPDAIGELSPDASSVRRASQQSEPALDETRSGRAGGAGDAVRGPEPHPENDSEDVKALLARARSHADHGALDEALAECHRALEIDPLSADAHFIMGMFHYQSDDKSKAITELKKATYIERDFPMAYFHLAEIYMSEKRWQEALRGYKNALRCITARGLDANIEYSGGFTNLLLTQTCEERIKTCERTLRRETGVAKSED